MDFRHYAYVKSIKKEGIIGAFFFISALLFLTFGKFGLLSVPGIIAAILGAFFSIKGCYHFSSFIGIVASATSFIGQGITLYCSSCTSAAVLFLMGGIVGIIIIIQKHLLYGFILFGVSCLSIIFFTINYTYIDTRDPVIYSETVEILSSDIPDNIPKLYLSVTCPGCKNVMEDAVLLDPLGEKWVPIIVPHSSYYQGEQMLQLAGYRGKILSAAKPPVNRVPVLKVKEEILPAGDIKFYLDMDK